MSRILRIGTALLLSILLFSAGVVSHADEVKFGDVDGDGEVTERDADAILDHFSRVKMMDAAAVTRADYDRDGIITENDVTMLLNALLSPDSAVTATMSFSMLITSDLFGNAWKPTSSDGKTACSALNTSAKILELREADPDLLLFDAGGSIFGSSVADEYYDKTGRGHGPITALFLKLGYDAVLLGDEAFSYPSNQMRKEVNALLDEKIPVLGANLLMRERTTFDPEGALWDELSPYRIFEVPQGDGKRPMRVVVIGMTEPDLSPSEDEILPADPLEIYTKLEKELLKKADYTVLLYHGNVEEDAQSPDSYSLRDFLKKTGRIDLVVVSHSKGKGTRSERNAAGVEVPIVSLAGGAETITKISVSLREFGRPAILVESIDPSDAVPDASLERIVSPYVSRLSGVMDATVCTVAQRIEPFDGTILCSSDAMELTHEMQIFAAKKWLAYQDIDLPGNMVSIAYPYIGIGEIPEGTLTYRDLCVLKTETPVYSLLLVRGSELRAWLSDYAGKLMDEDVVYSLYGVSYLLNAMNAELPLGYLENESGLSVDDDDVFTLILAERTEGDLELKKYLDEEWLSYNDRVITGMTLPTPEKITTLRENPIIDAFAAYLESVGTLKLKHTFSWILI